MKMTRKLIPALAMLLVSAIMLSTASFAWFASNNKVTAQDMTVTVQTTASFLEISSEETGTYLTYADATNKKYSTTDGKKGLDLVTARLADAEGADATTTKKVLTWLVGESGSTSSAKDENTNTSYRPATVDETTNYALVNSFFVKMSAGSTADISNLIITGVEVNELAKNNLKNALRVLVDGPDGIQVWTNTSGEWKPDTANSDAVLANTVSKSAVELKVYVYFDGDDTVAYTNNTYDTTGAQQVLGDLEVTVTFGPQSA